MDNANSKEYLDKILRTVLENLRLTQHAPSTQLTDIPPSLGMNDEDEAALDDLDEDEGPDKRMTQRRFDKSVEKNGELSESEDEDMAEANGVRRQPGARKRRQMINYRNIMDVGGDSGVDSGLGTPHVPSSLPDDGDEMNVDTAVAELAKSPAANDVSSANDGDITMGDADVETTESATADVSAAQEGVLSAFATEQSEDANPESTAAEVSDDTAQVKKEIIAEDEAVAAQEEGIQEREAMDTEGQARTEAAKAEL